ncbi:hypothetical protein BDQ12DRAFT_730679 [Crucibulum laeve]|uniref:RhoGAP-domain-containing protein n=1 Tax=Crucibulum laeve TaxID=68775 RepID=A0A5C3MIB9_9AGAR|nr:hypothetical protein BDQ12DRAFT_730679 [Crucibulum laeve]
MLAAMPPSQHDIPLREQSHLNLQTQSRDALPENSTLEDRLCPGCKKSAVSENGGLVVAFGQSFFHVDCFKCAKCGDKVTADTNLLLLSDGSPICANCSYSCNVCRLPILDEAIMTGDDSYHAHCFKCKVCKNRIDELVFAKTSQGIYCMGCHHERMIKMRKHTQRKAEREKAGGSGSSKSREHDARHHHRENGRSSPAVDTQSRPGSSRSQALQSSALPSRPNSSRGTDTSTGAPSPAKPRTGPYVSDAFQPTASIPASSSQRNGRSSNTPLPSPLVSLPQEPPAVNIAPSELVPLYAYANSHVSDDRPNPVKQSTLPVPGGSSQDDRDGRRRSYDDGVRPLNVLLKQKSLNSAANPRPESPALLEPSGSGGLSVGASKREKRRSINPGLNMADFQATLSHQSSSSTLSPHTESFRMNQTTTRSPTPPDIDARSTSPLREVEQTSPSRPNSHSGSIQSYHSFSSASHRGSDGTISRSRSPSVNAYDDGQDQTIVISSLNGKQNSAPPMRLQNPPMRSNVRPLPNPHARNSGGPSSRLSPTDGNGPDERFHEDHSRIELSRRASSTPSLQVEARRSASSSRPLSPGYRADVPHSVESGTDTEAEGESDNVSSEHRDSVPPAPPPKDRDNSEATSPSSEFEPDLSFVSIGDSSSDEMSESPVERTSHATFIAPAIPPIRFSLDAAGFSDLLSSVGGLNSMKAFDTLAKLSEQSEGLPTTPPPTAASVDSTATLQTPSSQDTVFPQNRAGEQRNTSSIDEDITITVTPRLDRKMERQDTISSMVSTTETLTNGERQSTQIPDLSLDDLGDPKSSTRITLTEPESTTSTTLRHESSDVVLLRLREAMDDAKDRGAQQLKLERSFIEAIMEALESRKSETHQLKAKLDGMKRTSKQYIEGLTVAQTEYDQELKARRDAEAEVSRLRVLLSGQAVRLSALSGDSRRQELRQQMSKELNDNLSGLEQDLSRLKAERDMALAEVEELSVTKSSVANSPDPPPANLGRTLTKRLDNIKSQYQRELVPLMQQREVLNREITELKSVRDMFLEETTVLNARNEELAQLTAVYARRIENEPEIPLRSGDSKISAEKQRAHIQSSQSQSTLIAPVLSSSTSSSSTIYDDADSRFLRSQKSDIEQHTPSKGGKFIKWPSSRKEVVSPTSGIESNKTKAAHLEHNFQQLSVLRFTRCDHCGDKMWGSQLRCTACNTSIHVRCIAHVQIPCTQQSPASREEAPQVPLPPSMFGRDLTEQVHADAKGGERLVPIIVEKCIEAVEALALDYEGIYRKTGGSGQSRAITQLFERGDYASFDLRDSDRFNDICSVTSVLKTYFRSLPVPLLTYDLHDQFMAAVAIRDAASKHQSLHELVNKLPDEHYYTLRMLMLHLHNVRQRCEKNLMTARNLGVVFGPTLLRSRDPAAEFSDMAGKALFVEWLVDNAPQIFNEESIN